MQGLSHAQIGDSGSTEPGHTHGGEAVEAVAIDSQDFPGPIFVDALEKNDDGEAPHPHSDHDMSTRENAEFSGRMRASFKTGYFDV